MGWPASGGWWCSIAVVSGCRMQKPTGQHRSVHTGSPASPYCTAWTGSTGCKLRAGYLGTSSGQLCGAGSRPTTETTYQQAMTAHTRRAALATHHTARATARRGRLGAWHHVVFYVSRRRSTRREAIIEPTTARLTSTATWTRSTFDHSPKFAARICSTPWYSGLSCTTHAQSPYWLTG
jgi:hypothetical protein